MILTRVRQAARAAGFVGFTGVMIPLYVSRDRTARLRHTSDRDALRDRWVKRWADGLLALFSIRVETLEPVPPPIGRGRLVVSNHRSAIDIGVPVISLMSGTQAAVVRFMLVGLGIMLLMIFRPQGILGDRKELALDAR